MTIQPVSSTTTVQTNTTQTTTPTAAATPVKKTWTDSYNGWVNWTSKNSFDCVNSYFSIKTVATPKTDKAEEIPADGTLKKVAKFFAFLLAQIVLLPCAALGTVYNCICPKVTETDKGTAKTEEKKASSDNRTVTIEKNQAGATTSVTSAPTPATVPPAPATVPPTGTPATAPS